MSILLRPGQSILLRAAPSRTVSRRIGRGLQGTGREPGYRVATSPEHHPAALRRDDRYRQRRPANGIGTVWWRRCTSA